MVSLLNLQEKYKLPNIRNSYLGAFFSPIYGSYYPINHSMKTCEFLETTNYGKQITLPETVNPTTRKRQNIIKN
ncbi:MAG: hypothetical protein V1870_02905 [Candidatus Aenigmatarchaeota archaeon]